MKQCRYCGHVNLNPPGLNCPVCRKPYGAGHVSPPPGERLEHGNVHTVTLPRGSGHDERDG